MWINLIDILKILYLYYRCFVKYKMFTDAYKEMNKLQMFMNHPQYHI